MRLLLLLGGLAVGCGDNWNAGDGGVAGTTGGGGTSGGTGAGGGAVVSGTKVFSGNASMLFHGPSCTNEIGATGDRWCAFLVRASSDARNLFVVNVSQVVAGVAVTCGAGADPNCLLLTPSIGSRDPSLHGTLFQGDTLVYYDAALTPFVWRPGMTSGRRLVDVSTTVQAVFCTPARTGTAVACLGLPPTQPDMTLTRADVLTGKSDAASEPLLTVVDNVIVANTADAVGTPRFSLGFPEAPGDYVAWSAREVATGPEILKLQKAGDPASKVTVASDVNGWGVSPDGTQWFWLSTIASNGVGTLQTAPFPSGANPTDVLASTFQYGLPPTGGKAVMALTIGGALLGIADPVAAPAAQVPLDTQVQTLLSYSARGHVAYVKHFFGTNLVDLFVEKGDGTESCVVDATTRAHSASVYFTPDAGATVWALSRADTFDGYYVRLSDCSRMTIAPDVVVLASIGENVVAFMDQFDSSTGTGSMRFVDVAAGNTLQTGAPTPIADHVTTYAISDPAPGTITYTINTGGSTDGVYIRWFGP